MKLKTGLFISIILFQLSLNSQSEIINDEFINCVHTHERIAQKSSNSGEIQFSVKPLRVIEMSGIIPEPQYISIEVQSEVEIDSIKILAFDYVSLSNVALFMLDDGLNGDDQANDNIYTSTLPIRLTFPPSPDAIGLYYSWSTKCKYHFYLKDGTTKKYSNTFNTFYFSEDGLNQYYDHIENNPVTQINDSVYSASNIIHVVSKNKNYSENTINYLTSDFQDLDQVFGDDYSESEIMIFYSYNDIDKESGGYAGSYTSFTKSIRSKSLRFGLLNHESLHVWVGGTYRTYDLTFNNGHWGYIESPSSAFYSGCYGGVFQELSVDPSSGEVEVAVENYFPQFSNLELFLMNRLPIDSVKFPLIVVTGDDLNCSGNTIENGTLDSLSKEEFLTKHENYQATFPYDDFGDTINYKTVLLYDQRLSDEEILLYSFVMKQYEVFFAESTRQNCYANTSIFKDIDADGFSAIIDCDDSNPNINPSQQEVPYNGLDDDCNELTLDDDLDQDGFLLVDDCDDTNININPNQIEEPYNGLDDDCNETTLDDDLDQDGFLLADDCDDNNSDINPNEEEEPYNGLDDDCNELTLDDDLDQDGFLLVDDCDDTNMNINPNQIEEPYNGLDDDCNETTLDDDLDQDGFLLAEDCDDTNSDINPNGEEEPYNGLDDDCDETTLDDDLDQDGFLLIDDCDDTDPNINPDAEEIGNNGIDENCDGMDLVTSIHQLSNSEIKIYPNPVVDIIYIEIVGQLNYQVSLFDLNGKLVTTANNSKLIEISSIPQGTYLLEIKDTVTGFFAVEKIIVSK